MVITRPAPPTTEVPNASDSAIESNSIPRRIPAPPLLRSAITYATVNKIDPNTKKTNIIVIPIVFSVSITIAKIAAEIKMPTPKAIKNNKW